MKRTSLLVLALAACAHANEPALDTADDAVDDNASGDETAHTADAGDIAVAPAALPGNHAVQARLTPLPAPPQPWTTPVAALTPEDFGTLCPYLDANVHLEGSTVTCPDGSSASVTEHHCVPETWSTAARSLPCTISLGEMVACRLAMVEHPCDGGPYGENLDECEAFERCTLDGARPPEVTR